MRETAVKTAEAEGTSLNHFINLAIAEKLTRMERDKPARAAAAGMVRTMYREGVRLN